MRNKETKKPYFGEREEQAVIDYINSDSKEEKNKIYNEILIEPFRKMIESILRRYPIHIGNYDMAEVEENALTHLIEHMIKYKPFIIEKYTGEMWIKLSDKYKFTHIEDAKQMLNRLIGESNNESYRIFNSKAFSYCQTIIRNYYKDHSKKSYTEKKINLCYDDYSEEITKNPEYSYEIEQDNSNNLENLINIIVDKFEDRIENDDSLKRNEVVVGDAIINILKNWHILFMEDTPEGNYNKRVTNKYAKNKILLFLKEQTELSTKEIRAAIKPFKDIYFIEKVNFMDD
jgi:hypothetical protein